MRQKQNDYGRKESAEEAAREFARDCRYGGYQDGQKGSIDSKDGRLYQAAPYIVEAVDTTGAGDSFNAGFVYGFLRGKSMEECLKCGNRFTTYERLGDNPIIVVKSDGTTQVFDREKLYRGISIACAKRPNIPNEKKAEIIDDIEAELRAAGRLEIKSKDLGDIVLEHLRGLDDVAYIRFASVYKDFQTVEEFREALEGLQ